jgi:acyl-coenzyme A synthetase/AMP-(fatty) acid ligase
MNFPKIYHPHNLAWCVFWAIMFIMEVKNGDTLWCAIAAGFGTWNWFLAIRE